MKTNIYRKNYYVKKAIKYFQFCVCEDRCSKKKVFVTIILKDIVDNLLDCNDTNLVV